MYRNHGSNRRRSLLYTTRGRSVNFRGTKSFDPTLFIRENPKKEEVFEEEQIVNKFNDFKISDNLKQNILAKGYITPTPIQDKAIPDILEGKDMIGIANTGTGKTAAFLIPLIQKITDNRTEKVLIIAPTRELAIQINEELWGFTKNLGIYSALCIGGTNIKRQMFDLSRRPNFVIGTPGRIMDLTRNKNIHLSDFGNVVLDEADRMVDIGFLKDIKYMISLLPYNRQSLFFSATVGPKVHEILGNFVKNPVVVSVKRKETTDNIRQDTIKVSNPGDKIVKLHELLIQKDYEKVLIFGRTKHGVQRLSDNLRERGFKSEAIHGNKNQSQRIKILDQFKKSEIKILIATDVASRGLDIPNVSHVINYDLPESKDAYIHRIGRTGRADKKGIALTFV